MQYRFWSWTEVIAGPVSYDFILQPKNTGSSILINVGRQKLSREPNDPLRLLITSRAPPLMLSIVERALIAKRDKLVKQKDD